MARVLVVNDDVHQLFHLCKEFEKRGFEYVASDGRGSLEAWVRESQPNIIAFCQSIPHEKLEVEINSIRKKFPKVIIILCDDLQKELNIKAKSVDRITTFPISEEEFKAIHSLLKSKEKEEEK